MTKEKTKEIDEVASLYTREHMQDMMDKRKEIIDLKMKNIEKEEIYQEYLENLEEYEEIEEDRGVCIIHIILEKHQEKYFVTVIDAADNRKYFKIFSHDEMITIYNVLSLGNENEKQEMLKHLISSLIEKDVSIEEYERIPKEEHKYYWLEKFLNNADLIDEEIIDTNSLPKMTKTLYKDEIRKLKKN